MTSPILNAARKRDTSPEQQRWEAKVYPWSIGNRALWSPKMDADRFPMRPRPVWRIKPPVSETVNPFKFRFGTQISSDRGFAFKLSLS